MVLLFWRSGPRAELLASVNTDVTHLAADHEEQGESKPTHVLLFEETTQNTIATALNIIASAPATTQNTMATASKL